MTQEEKRHRDMAEAIGMSWEEYLEINPHLKEKFKQ